MGGFENDVVVAKNLNFDEAAAKPHLGILNVAGKIPIATGNTSPTPEILGGSLTSPLGTLSIGYVSPNITIDLVGGGVGIDTITPDSGGPVAPAASGNINVNAGNSTLVSGSSVSFIGTPGSNLVQLHVTDSSQRTIIGQGAGNLTISNSGFDTVVGYQAGASMTSGLGGNNFFGWKSGNAVTSGNNLTAQGQSSLLLATTAVQSVAIGNNALSALTTGSYNIGIGYAAGIALTTSDSSNIIISNDGTSGDNNTLRIGRQGSGNAQVNKSFIAGIVGVSVSNPQFVTINSSTGQLGVSAAVVSAWTDVTGATQTLAVGNGYITNRGGGVTYTLPATATVGDEIKIVGKLGLTTIAQNANQAIRIGSSISSTGAGGSVAGTNVGDCITLRCTTGGASTIWIAESLMGNWTIV